MGQRLLVISPVRNEAAHIERVARALAGQSRPPDLWLVVDDGSDDETPAILAELAEQLGFMDVRRVPQSEREVIVKDRLAAAAAPRTFNYGLNSVAWQRFTHVAKLDGDTELPPRYFELLLAEFASNSRLGLAGGVRRERIGGRERLERVPVRHHVPGALKCYTRECFEAIGGMPERLAWDTIDEVRARMSGFETRAFPEMVAVHHRTWGSADGLLRGRARHGRCAYIVHYPFHWVALRAIKTARMRPWGLSGIAYLGGYLGAAVRSVAQVEDPGFRSFLRGELRERRRDSLAAMRTRTSSRLMTVQRGG